MPATKKVVNPEKELRGKKPYNRGPDGLKKKTYQAKPKKLDNSEVIEGAAALKKKLRDTLRLISKNPKMPADIRLEHERRIEALKLQIADKQVDKTEQKMATKYRMLKFFESKKVDRKIKVFMRQHPNWESNEYEKKELDSLKLDLAYIQHFPKTQKYISLYPNENADDSVSSSARDEIREKIRLGLESGEIEQFVKITREDVKSKIISKDKLTTEEAIKLTTEKINNSKKRVRDEQDPLAARAKATAEREATKPKQEEEEEESFFEPVSKPDSAAKTKEPKKKAENPTTPTQPKKDQPKKGQNKKEQPKQETAPESEGNGQDKKLGKWARKAIRNQSAEVAKAAKATPENSTATQPESDSGANDVADSVSQTSESSVATDTDKKQPNEKKESSKKSLKRNIAAESKNEDKKAKIDNISSVEQDAPRITVLKVDQNDKGESDSDNDDEEEPVVPIRKIVKIDESLLKELPEVPKRRGGRNLNKFKK